MGAERPITRFLIFFGYYSFGNSSLGKRLFGWYSWVAQESCLINTVWLKRGPRYNGCLKNVILLSRSTRNHIPHKDYPTKSPNTC